MSILAVSPSVSVKLAALAARVQELLSAHDEDFAREGAVATYLDDAVVANERNERLALMAVPDHAERYAELIWVGEAPAGVETLFSGEPLDVRDRFHLFVHWGVRRGTDDLAYAAADFRAALRSRSETAPGVVEYLRTFGSIEYTDPETDEAWEIEVRVEPDLATSFRLIDRRNGEYRHEAAVTLTATGAPLA